MHYFKTILKNHFNTAISFFWPNGCRTDVILVKRSAGKLSSYFEQFKCSVFSHEGSPVEFGGCVFEARNHSTRGMQP